MRVTAAIGLIGAGLLLAGCGSGTVSGDADAEGVAAGEPIFSPCDDIPDSALAEVGVDLGTESRDIMGVKQPGWKICMWQGESPAPALSVFATNHTLDDVRANPRNVEFAEIQVGDRQAISYRETTDKDRRNCDVALSSGGGAVLISVAYLGLDAVLEEPCAVAEHRAQRLAEYIPQ